MKITITVDSTSVAVVKKDAEPGGVGSTLLMVDFNAQSIQEIAALVAKIVGTEVAQAITATTGGE